MRGVIIQKILSNLDTRIFEELVSFVQTRSATAEFLPLCNFLRIAPYTEEDAMSILKVNKRKKNSLLESLGSLISSFFGQLTDGFGLESGVELGKRLVLAVENDAARTILKASLEKAVDLERYDVVLRCWSLIKMMQVEHGIEAMSLEEASKHLAVGAQLQGLLDRIPRTRKIQDLGERNSELQQIRNRSLQLFGSMQLGQKAQLSFLRIQAQTDLLLRDSLDFFKSQEAVVAQIEANPWVCEDWEFEFAREQRILSQLYWQAEQYDAFRLACAKFWLASFTSKRAMLEKAIHQYPFLFGLAIDSGDAELGHKSVQEFENLVENGLFENSPRLITQNYYFAAYFYIAANKGNEARKIIAKLMRFSKSEFLPHHHVMLSFLKIVLAIDDFDFEDAQRILKNLSASKNLDEIAGARLGIEFFKFIVNESITSWHSKPEHQKIKRLLSKLKAEKVSNYFNFENWYQSKIDRRPMLEIFKHQAATNGSFMF